MQSTLLDQQGLRNEKLVHSAFFFAAPSSWNPVSRPRKQAAVLPGCGCTEKEWIHRCYAKKKHIQVQDPGHWGPKHQTEQRGQVMRSWPGVMHRTSTEVKEAQPKPLGNHSSLIPCDSESQEAWDHFSLIFHSIFTAQVQDRAHRAFLLIM